MTAINSLTRSAEHFNRAGLHEDDTRSGSRRRFNFFPLDNIGPISVQLVHKNGDPLTHQKVKIYANGFFRLTEIASETTDPEGRFTFTFNRAGFNENDRLILRVFEEILPTNSFLSAFKPTERTIFETDFKVNRSEEHFEVPLYEYPDEDEDYLPRLRQPSNSSQKPQQETLDYKAALLKAGADEQVKDFAARLIRTHEGLEALYGVHDTSLTLISETTVDLLLNGIYPCPFLKGSDPSSFLVDINWDKYEVDSGNRPVLPNIRIDLTLQEKELSVKNISVQFRGGNWSHYELESRGFERALYLANSMALIKGEIVSHLGLGHLYTEQNAMAVFRTINVNPIGRLLKPHLRGVLEINHRGTELIFGPEGILNISGLSVTGITKSLQDVLSGVCYSNFEPRTPVTENHTFAHAEKIYWDIITETVDQFFEENKLGIENAWYEVVYMSKCLVEHSLPYKPWEGVEDHARWRDGTEVDDPNFPGRVVVNGYKRAIRPITHSDPTEGPNPEDIIRLKQFSRQMGNQFENCIAST